MNKIDQSKSADTAILSLRNVSKIYGEGNNKITIFENLNLDIKQGEMVALVAPSGAGKSTLLHIAGLLDDATSGDVIVKNNSTQKLSDRGKTKLRNETIGFVYQFHHLLPELTALENVAFPLRIAGKRKKDALQNAGELLLPLGLEERLDHYPSQMSGGEQQRCAIARALANSPDLLLADEPTGNLDPETAEIVFQQLQTMVQQRNHAALIATHNIELAKRMDRCLTLVDHRLETLHFS